MFWKSRAQSNPSRSGLQSLRAPLALEIEFKLRDEMHRCIQAADWGGLKHVLRQLERKKSSLGEASVAAIVNSRASSSSPTALHLVCGRGQSHELASRLLALGAEPDEPSILVTMRNGFPTNDRPTPLYIAIAHGDLKLTKLLLRHGAQVSQQNSLGETPLMFSLRTLLRWDDQESDFERVLLKAGANPRIADLDGMTPLAEYVLNERWAAAARLVEMFPGQPLITQRVQQRIVDRFLQIGLSALARAEQDRSPLRAFLRNLGDLSGGLGASAVSAIFNSSIKGGASLFARMIEFGVPRIYIAKAEMLGGLLTAIFDSRIKTTDIKGVMALHHVVASNDPALIEWALKRVGPWVLKDPVGEQRLSPLHLLYLAHTPANLEAARLLIEAGADPLAVTNTGENLYEMAVAAGDAAGIDLWTEYLTNPFIEASPVIREMMLTDEEFLRLKSEFSELGRMRLGLPKHIEKEMKRWAGNENDAAHSKRCREYMEAYYVAKDPSRWGRANPEMYRLLPRAMLRKDPSALVSIVKAIDTLNDRNEEARGRHPFQAELMTLLAHPGVGGSQEGSDEIAQGLSMFDSRRELRTAVTLALTSIHRFNNLNIFNVSAATVNFWGRVGVTSFSFRYQKWDALGIRFGDNRLLSLFERFGFSPLRGADGDTLALGTGYELSRERKERIRDTLGTLGVKFDPNVRIQFFEGCKRASLAGVGDFIVRNSARSYLPKHPAYFSRLTVEEGLSSAEATLLTPSVIEDSFMPVLQSTLYADSASAVAEMEYLLSHIEAVDRELDCWKFDTRRETAWDTIEGIGTVLRGGYYSDGFSDLVNYLTSLVGAQTKKGEPPPQLAFFPRHLPAWQPISYRDLDGKEYTSLDLTPTTVELLKKLQSSSADRNDFRNDNGRTFHFFQMGLEQGAALVIVDGKEVNHEMQ